MVWVFLSDLNNKIIHLYIVSWVLPWVGLLHNLPPDSTYIWHVVSSVLLLLYCRLRNVTLSCHIIWMYYFDISATLLRWNYYVVATSHIHHVVLHKAPTRRSGLSFEEVRYNLNDLCFYVLLKVWNFRLQGNVIHFLLSDYITTRRLCRYVVGRKSGLRFFEVFRYFLN